MTEYLVHEFRCHHCGFTTRYRHEVVYGAASPVVFPDGWTRIIRSPGTASCELICPDHRVTIEDRP